MPDTSPEPPFSCKPRKGFLFPQETPKWGDGLNTSHLSIGDVAIPSQENRSHVASDLKVKYIYQQQIFGPHSTCAIGLTTPQGAKSRERERQFKRPSSSCSSTPSEPLTSSSPQEGRRRLIWILRGFLTWIGNRKRKLRSKHNDEGN